MEGGSKLSERSFEGHTRGILFLDNDSFLSDTISKWPYYEFNHSDKLELNIDLDSISVKNILGFDTV